MEELTIEKAKELILISGPLHFPNIRLISNEAAAILAEHISFDIKPSTFNNDGYISEDDLSGSEFEIRFGAELSMSDDCLALFDSCYTNLLFDNQEMQAKYEARFPAILRNRILRRFKDVYNKLKNDKSDRIISKEVQKIGSSISNGTEIILGYQEADSGLALGFLSYMDDLTEEDYVISTRLNEIDRDCLLPALCIKYEYFEQRMQNFEITSGYFSNWKINLKEGSISISRKILNSDWEEEDDEL